MKVKGLDKCIEEIAEEYYPAVMFACKMIRENGYYNRAINISANYYGVDRGILDEIVEARQVVGPQGKKQGTHKTYRFKGEVTYIRGELVHDEAQFDLYI